ncbi:MAG: hypothetical protein M0C28_37330 [Candidatus Moduliflexus flocculans]|nr:hypothetical protein [Candidatus Moduliflexus flocculans]
MLRRDEGARLRGLRDQLPQRPGAMRRRGRRRARSLAADRARLLRRAHLPHRVRPAHPRGAHGPGHGHRRRRAQPSAPQRVILSGAGLVKDGTGRRGRPRAEGGGPARGRAATAAHAAWRSPITTTALSSPRAAPRSRASSRGRTRRWSSFLVDCGWAYRAGVDLAAFFTAHRARIAGLHLRDFKGEQQVPLGQGEVELGAARLGHPRRRPGTGG